MKLRKVISTLAVLIFTAAWLVNPLTAFAAPKWSVTLSGKSQAGKVLTNPFKTTALLTLHAKGKWNHRGGHQYAGDADGYAKGTCPPRCPSSKLVPRRLVTVSFRNRHKILGSGKNQKVKLAPRQKVRLVMNDNYYRNNSGVIRISYKFTKLKGATPRPARRWKGRRPIRRPARRWKAPRPKVVCRKVCRRVRIPRRRWRGPRFQTRCRKVCRTIRRPVRRWKGRRPVRRWKGHRPVRRWKVRRPVRRWKVRRPVRHWRGRRFHHHRRAHRH